MRIEHIEPSNSLWSICADALRHDGGLRIRTPPASPHKAAWTLVTLRQHERTENRPQKLCRVILVNRERQGSCFTVKPD